MVKPSTECLSTVQLVEESRKEIQHFLHHQTTSNECAFELFRRAITLRDEYAWCALYELYKGLVASWIIRSRHRVAAIDACDRESLVNQAFARFYRSVTPQRLAGFHSVESLLAYLRSCARSAALDDLRSQKALAENTPPEDVSVEPYSDDPADTIVSALCFSQVLRCIEPLLSSEQERVIFQETVDGSRPQDIVASYPELFRSVDEIYNGKRNILERLRRNRQLKAILREVA